MSTKPSKGFTLIELMIVVAIIAILAAIAIPAYTGYVREARMSKVLTHYDDAIRLVRNEVAKNAAVQARGNPSIIPSNSSGWVNFVNPNNAATAPVGALPAYDVQADNDNGVIGVAYDSGRRVVTVTLPSYLELSEHSTTRETIDVH